MDDEKPPLLKLPLELLNKVTKDIDIITTCRLRKTCRYFKNYVDSGEIDLKLDYMTIERDRSDKCYDIEVAIALPLDKLYKMKYVKAGSDCKVRSVEGLNDKEWKVTYIRNADVAETVGNDIGLLLRNQKTLMNKIIVDGYKIKDSIGRLLSSLESQLKLRKVLLPVETLLFVNINDEQQIMSILSKVDPTYFDKFFRFCKSSFSSFTSEDMNMENIIRTEQWKQATEVHTSRNSRNDSMKDYYHFKNANFHIKQISSQDVFELKEIKLQDPSFRYYLIDYDTLTKPHLLKKLLGEPVPPANPFATVKVQQWYYRIPNSDKALEVSENTNQRSIAFYIRNVTDVPANATFN